MAKSAGEQIADTHRPNAPAVHKSVAELKAESMKRGDALPTAIDLTTKRSHHFWVATPGPATASGHGAASWRGGRALDLLRLARNALPASNQPIHRWHSSRGRRRRLTLCRVFDDDCIRESYLPQRPLDMRSVSASSSMLTVR